MGDLAGVWAAEQALLDPSVRRDREALTSLLHEDFAEIGQSGRRWSRDEILELLLGEDPVQSAPVITERTALLVADGLVLITYRLEFGGGHSRRSSLWTLDPLQILFHQGTPLPLAAA